MSDPREVLYGSSKGGEWILRSVVRILQWAEWTLQSVVWILQRLEKDIGPCFEHRELMHASREVYSACTMFMLLAPDMEL